MKKIMKITAVLLVLTAALITAMTVNAANKEYPTVGSGKSAPPMGFNTWYVYLDGWTAESIQKTVSEMEKKGLRDLGYQYIQIDWGWCTGDRDWYEKRTPEGKMNPDPLKFPTGSPLQLAGYLHKRGFRIGYYTDTGFDGVGNGIGSAGHIEEDLDLFRSWNMDFIKFDSGGGNGEFSSLYEAYRAFLQNITDADYDTPVPVCLCGLDQASAVKIADEFVGEKIPFVYYRVAADISSTIPKVNWDDPTYSVLATFDAAMAHPENSRPGCYFDMDTLMLENNGLNPIENKAYFTMFCIAPSTLFLAVDVPNMSDATLELISNEEAIAVNQDPLCNAARLVREDRKGLQVYSKVQSDNLGRKERAVMLFNRNPEAAEISVDWSDIGLEGECLIRDIWNKKDIEPDSEGYKTMVASHGVVFLRITENTEIIGDTAGTSADTEETGKNGTDNKDNGEALLIGVSAAAAAAAVTATAVYVAKGKKKR